MAPPYTVEFTPSAEHQFLSLPRGMQNRIRLRVDALANNPRPSGCKKMAGSTETYRIRVGEYRIVYDVLDQILVVLVVRIGHRREVYR